MDKGLLSFLNKESIYYEENVDLKTKTWIHRGGMCDVFILPKNSNELKIVGQYLYANQLEFLLIGHTSNLYVLNDCNLSIVLSTNRCNHYILKQNEIYCEAGASVIRMARDMISLGFSGFEFLTGLPGTVGAALYNNSSCKTNSIAQLMISADVLEESGNIITLFPKDMDFSFRNSVFKDGRRKGIILSIRLKADLGDKDTLVLLSKRNEGERKSILEGNSKNLGCTVNRPFVNGRMALHYRILLKIYGLFLRLIQPDRLKRKKKQKVFLCKISGYGQVAPYISDKNPIIFIWKDDGADKAFPLYLEFMRNIYKTDKVEIEIIR